MSRTPAPALAIMMLVLGAPAQAQMAPPAPVPYGAGYGAPPMDDDTVGMAPSYPVAPESSYRRAPAPYYYGDVEPPAPIGSYRAEPIAPAYPPQGAPVAVAPPGASRIPGDYHYTRQSNDAVYRPPGEVAGRAAPDARTGGQYASLPPDYRPETSNAELAARFRRQLVSYRTNQPAGTIVIDTSNTYLYYVLGNGQAVRYGIGVGREGFTWSGEQRISRMAEWPDWHPPSEMIGRQPDLPRFMAGGEGNPLGARALYLGNTLYRIHGTNQPSTIGTFVSSGCIRLLNDDVADLYQRVKVGTRVVVLPGSPRSASLPRDAAR